MNKLALVVPLLVVAIVAMSPKKPQSVERRVSLVSRLLQSYTPPSPREASAALMATAGQEFLNSLTAELHSEAALPLKSNEREVWTNVPPSGPQGGVRLGDLNEAQIKQALDLLAATLSDQGLEKIRSILLADDELLVDGRPRPGFGAENYWLAVFGKPSSKERWAWQLDGHHIAVNVTIQGKDMCLSPSFIGTQPSRFELGGREIVPLRGETEHARRLVNLLDPVHQNTAIISSTRGRNVAAAGRDGFIPQPKGLLCTDLTDPQRSALLTLIADYVHNLPEPHASRRMQELSQRVADMHFAWSGPTAPNRDISYRLQGPGLIIEYACQDLGGNPLDHLHTMYRDPTNEYGAKLGE